MKQFIIGIFLLLAVTSFAQKDSNDAKRSFYLGINGGLATGSLNVSRPTYINIEANSGISAGISGELDFNEVNLGLIATANYHNWNDSGSAYQVFSLTGGPVYFGNISKHISLSFKIQGGVAYCVIPSISINNETVYLLATHNSGESAMESFYTPLVKALSATIDIATSMRIKMGNRLFASFEFGYSGVAFKYSNYTQTTQYSETSGYFDIHGNWTSSTTNYNPPVVTTRSFNQEIDALCFHLTVGVGVRL